MARSIYGTHTGLNKVYNRFLFPGMLLPGYLANMKDNIAEKATIFNFGHHVFGLTLPLLRLVYT